MFYVEKTIPEDCFRLAPNLKQLDKYEVAVMGYDPLTALLMPLTYNRPNTHIFTLFEKETNKIILSTKLFLKIAEITPKIIPKKIAKTIEDNAKTNVALNVLDIIVVTGVPILTNESRKYGNFNTKI